MLHLLESRSSQELPVSEIEALYVDAAYELKSKQSTLENYHDELSAFLHLRDVLQEHPEFSGALPQTFFSGGDLDPTGTPPP